MRRSRLTRLLASVTAGVVVSLGVPGYAAGLLHDGPGLASGAAIAIGCDPDGVTTRYSVNASSEGFVVDKVEVSGIDAGCAGGTVHVELQAADGTMLGAGSAAVSGPVEAVALGTAVAPDAVAGVHVVLAR